MAAVNNACIKVQPSGNTCLEETESSSIEFMLVRHNSDIKYRSSVNTIYLSRLTDLFFERNVQ